ncbi:MAG: recombinase family protein [Trichocoleus desertorum ATA4-8-CV12]|nr:recombinase family protein [Trichocoleus desertorum ATA4-8-CV12]
MAADSVWIVGPTRSGKTTDLVNQFKAWVQAGLDPNGDRQTEPTLKAGHPVSERLQQLMVERSQRARMQETASAILVFAATGDNRLELVDRLTSATQGECPIQSATPIGFFQDEVLLFWPLLVEQLQLKAQFPVRLRPENEQELATRLWRSQLTPEVLQRSGVGEYRLVRRLLDWLQLAALAGIATENIPGILEVGLSGQDWALFGELLCQWRSWCLDRGLLTYGLLCELYWRYLLPNPTYQQHLSRRYQAVLADDVDNYPAIARQLFECLLDHGAVGAFTYNPKGGIRLGLGADPQHLADLATRCQVVELSASVNPGLANQVGLSVVEVVTDPLFLTQLPEAVQSLQTTSRAQLLRQTAQAIVEAVESGQAQPHEIAVIGPGVDAIARYTLREILGKHGIAVESINDQRPLASSAMVRALLTLLTLVYPNLGRLINRDAVAEMLVVLSQTPQPKPPDPSNTSASSFHPSSLLLHPCIDPVRAGLLADHCFEPHPDRPRLLPTTEFPRWDRLGYEATKAYDEIVQWIETQKVQQEQRLVPGAIAILDRAMQKFLWNGSHLPFDQLATLRELMETAQHYWEVDARLRQSENADTPASVTVGNFIQLLRGGTITADPYPVRSSRAANPAVTLATIFQYCSNRLSHRWQFWLDAGSPRWLTGSETLFGAPLFLQNWSSTPWTEADSMAALERRLQRILLDLLGRAGDRVFLCHSDLATNGQEQMGTLLSLVNASVPMVTEPMVAEETLMASSASS